VAAGFGGAGFDGIAVEPGAPLVILIQISHYGFLQLFPDGFIQWLEYGQYEGRVAE
jgi:hypothetical protein